MKTILSLAVFAFSSALLAQTTFVKASEPDKAFAMSLPIPRDRPEFTFSTYTFTTFAELALTATDDEKHMGMALFNERRRVVLTLPQYPIADLTDDERMLRDGYGKMNPQIRSISKCNHKLPIEIAGKKFLLLFQSQIVPYLLKEVKVGQNVILFVNHAAYDDFQKEHLIFVNEFYAPH